MKDLFLLTSVLLLSHYLSTVASPTINDTKSNETNIKNMDHAVKMERDNSRQNKVSHLESFLAPAVGIWRKKGNESYLECEELFLFDVLKVIIFIILTLILQKD